jgi:hypothetical protein
MIDPEESPQALKEDAPTRAAKEPDRVKKWRRLVVDIVIPISLIFLLDHLHMTTLLTLT